ncbi:hypothetical protein T458_24470 [Brevibacillus panacihumi W25]|uniref:Thymidylate kinase n=1 Tax=Brevibacillus panacihumi W25 TaxID=1408254 RepID=V6M2R4_9BACL|nr:AAA family ATPase [Brevibacillus panacihumi]EST52175.1 hypothetical protein T458_24470 [Brevibacillus panacihumi W25]
MNIHGKFICIYGIDGSGKSTLAQNISTYLSNFNEVKTFYSQEDAIFTPELEAVAKKLNTSRRECFSPILRGGSWGLDLLHKSMYHIEPALGSGKTVITDRYSICNLVYPYINNVDIGILRRINNLLIKPDLNVYLEVPHEIAWQRLKERGKKLTPKETPEKLQEAIKLYDYFFKIESISVERLDATLSTNQVTDMAIELIKSRFLDG